MTPESRLIRAGQLRDVLCAVRNARKALEAGDLPKAFRLCLQASGSLGFACGIWSRTTISATATLRKVVARLAIEVEVAAEPARAAEPVDLVPIIAAGIQILRTRDGSGVTDEQAVERARNIAGSLTWRFRFTHLPETVGKSGALPQ
jgi:hypothetical protein